MKIGYTGSVSNPRRVDKTVERATSAYGSTAASAPRNIVDSASVMGIPEAERTPKVRDAIMTLMGEVDQLRQSLDRTNKRLADMEQLADQDPLIPIYNRRAFVRELTKVQASVERYGSKASLIYIDLDGFKAVNDAHGHQAGDYVLAEIAKRLISSVRESDVVGRLGGDEFGLLLTHATEDAAFVLAARLPEQIANNPIVWEGQILDVSLSYGVYSFRPGEDVQTALAAADSAMYENKKASKRQG